MIAALVLAAPLAAQKADSTEKQAPPPEAKDKFANRRLAIGALGSQKVLVLPFAAVLVTDSAMTDTAAMRRWRDPVQGQAMADAAFTQALSIRAPEVSWILPDETRRMVKRAAGLLPEAERLGQVMLLRNGAKTLPDPLRAHLRTLSAMGGGRYALVPGGLVFRADTAGTTRVVMTLVVGDPRTGDVLWRTHAYGRGRTAEAALRAALDVTLPPEPTQP
jgi:hypothetical protein